MLVIGAGLAGLSCAYHALLEDPSCEVSVLDAAHLGDGASGRTTGMVTPGIGQDFAALVRRLGRAQAADLYRASLEAVRAVGDLVAGEGIACDHEDVGQLVVAQGPEGPRRLETQAAALESAGLPCVRLDGVALEDRLRFLGDASRGHSLAALHLPHAATVNPLRLVHGLAHAVRRRGGKVFERTRVRAIAPGRSARVMLESGPVIDAGSVILATASESTHLTRLTGRVMPISLKVLATRPLTTAQLAQAGWPGRECVIDSRRLFNYFRLTSDHRIVFGGGSPAYGAAPAGEPSFEDLLRELHATFRLGQPLAVERQWWGTIDYTLDGLPVIGAVRPHRNVFYAGGFCGHGIAMSIHSGRQVARMALKRAASPSFAGLRPQAPLVPGDWLRRLCFSAASGWMRWREA